MVLTLWKVIREMKFRTAGRKSESSISRAACFTFLGFYRTSYKTSLKQVRVSHAQAEPWRSTSDMPPWSSRYGRKTSCTPVQDASYRARHTASLALSVHGNKSPCSWTHRARFGQCFQLSTVQVCGLLPFFWVGNNIRVIFLKPFIKPFSFQSLHIFLHMIPILLWPLIVS